jgi:hypothetical protein
MDYRQWSTSKEDTSVDRHRLLDLQMLFLTLLHCCYSHMNSHRLQNPFQYATALCPFRFTTLPPSLTVSKRLDEILKKTIFKVFTILAALRPRYHSGAWRPSYFTFITALQFPSQFPAHLHSFGMPIEASEEQPLKA